MHMQGLNNQAWEQVHTGLPDIVYWPKLAQGSYPGAEEDRACCLLGNHMHDYGGIDEWTISDLCSIRDTGGCRYNPDLPHPHSL